MKSVENFTNVNQWLQYFESIHPVSIDLTLDRMMSVAKELRLDLIPGRIITVTGTNGKGSVSNLIARLLERAGCSVSVYNSPHLIRFNERITVCGKMISDELLLEAFTVIETERSKQNVTLTFFEITTLAAFYAFKNLPADYVVLEVGMGGRYDSTNIVDAEISVITNVAIDHTSFLGSTREEIGYQKVGIVKNGSHLVYGEPNIPETVRDYANKQNSKIIINGKDFGYVITEDGNTFDYCGLNQNVQKIPVPPVPVENAANAMAVLELLGFKLAELSPLEVIGNFSMPGRMEKIWEHPDVFVDVGHNSHAFAFVKKKLALINSQNDKKVFAVVGMLRDKDFTIALNDISESVDRFYFGSIPGARGNSSQNLKNALIDSSLKDNAQCFDSVIDAFCTACSDAREDDIVLVIGSFHAAGPVLEFIEKRNGAQLLD